mgnify:CR=1 FL=1
MVMKLFTVTLESLTSSSLVRQRGLGWNDAQKVAAQYRRWPANPRAWLVTIRPEETGRGA